MTQRQRTAQGMEQIFQAIEDVQHLARRLQTQPSSQTLARFFDLLHHLQQTLEALLPLLNEQEPEEILRSLSERLQKQQATAAGQPSKHQQILIVEDEADTAEMFAEMLGIQGYRVEKIYRAEAAIQYLEQHRPDAIVLDIMMPEVSGLEVLHFVRQKPRLRDIPVLIVSAKAIPSEIQEVLNAGANAYLTKPVTFAEFVETLNDLLQQSASS